MSHKAKVSGSEKIAAVEKLIFTWKVSLNHLAALLDVQNLSVRQWLQTYQSLGPKRIASNITECILLRKS
ncbi:hypothetical protein [Paenibacillus larvae]|uniref:hypothetical protein n=1 Tax=Paenibacillus larvae TaxID=1464 RepID=UPI0028918E83|nr:hypothetical protein [Paenibacillus larvae]MDT2191774.1 hypothetical protein [Paenibacillus larvae]